MSGVTIKKKQPPSLTIFASLDYNIIMFYAGNNYCDSNVRRFKIKTRFLRSNLITRASFLLNILALIGLFENHFWVS